LIPAAPRGAAGLYLEKVRVRNNADGDDARHHHPHPAVILVFGYRSMNALWQSITLAKISAAQWARNSLVLRWAGLLGNWRSRSLLLWGDGLAVLLCSIVFAIAPIFANNYMALFALAAIGVWVLLTLAEQRPRWASLTMSHLLLVLYWFIALLATAFSPVKTAAASGLAKLSLYLLVFAVLERLVRSPRWRSVLITVYLMTALFVTLYGVRQLIFGAEALATWVDPTSSSAEQIRVYSYLKNPNLLAGYLLPAIPLSIAAFFEWRSWVAKGLAVVMLGMHLVCIYGTGCRGAWLGMAGAVLVLGVLLLFWVLPRLPEPWRVWVFPAFIGLLMTVIGAGLLFSQAFRDRALSIFAGREDSSNNFRITVWTSVQEMIRAYPILGIGPGNSAFNQIYPLFQRPNYSALGAYSIYLELMVEVGLVGFAVFMWFLVTVFDRGVTALIKFRDRHTLHSIWLMGALASMVGMMIHGIVDTVWYRPELATVWWLMVALVVAIAVSPNRTMSNESTET
jgi:putative inorganic carbon (HCO3(-)) transporter